MHCLLQKKEVAVLQSFSIGSAPAFTIGCSIASDAKEEITAHNAAFFIFLI